jgi:hypothetical protein
MNITLYDATKTLKTKSILSGNCVESIVITNASGASFVQGEYLISARYKGIALADAECWLESSSSQLTFSLDLATTGVTDLFDKFGLTKEIPILLDLIMPYTFIFIGRAIVKIHYTPFAKDTEFSSSSSSSSSTSSSSSESSESSYSSGSSMSSDSSESSESSWSSGSSASTQSSESSDSSSSSVGYSSSTSSSSSTGVIYEYVYVCDNGATPDVAGYYGPLEYVGLPSFPRYLRPAGGSLYYDRTAGCWTIITASAYGSWQGSTDIHEPVGSYPITLGNATGAPNVQLEDCVCGVCDAGCDGDTCVTCDYACDNDCTCDGQCQAPCDLGCQGCDGDCGLCQACDNDCGACQFSCQACDTCQACDPGG